VDRLSQGRRHSASGDEKHQPAILVRDSSARSARSTSSFRAHLMVKDGDESRLRRAREDSARNTRQDITAVSRELSNFSRPATQGSPSSAKSTESSAMEISPRACAKLRRKRRWQDHQEYSIPRGVHINVQEGDHVKAGEASSMARSTCTTCSPSSARSSRNRTWSMPFRRFTASRASTSTTSTSRRSRAR